MRALPAAALLLVLFHSPLRADDAVRVYAAASLTSAIGEISAAWEKAGHPKPILVFAATSALAKQIRNGAPVDLVASADRKWMDYLAQHKKIAPASRVDLLVNELVLIVPKGRTISVTLDRSFDLAGAFKGKVCTGEPDVVPVGTYAKQALSSYGWWAALAPRVVGTDDVRTALAFVERGECPLGIVYATDAAISSKVEVVGRFPPGTHEPIVYPFAIVAGAGSQASPYLEYLRSDAARQIFEKYGFTPAPPP